MTYEQAEQLLRLMQFLITMSCITVFMVGMVVGAIIFKR